MTLRCCYILLLSFKKDQLKKINFTPTFQDLGYVHLCHVSIGMWQSINVGLQTLKISNQPVGHEIKYQANTLLLLFLFHFFFFPDRMTKNSQRDYGEFPNRVFAITNSCKTITIEQKLFLFPPIKCTLATDIKANHLI